MIACDQYGYCPTDYCGCSSWLSNADYQVTLIDDYCYSQPEVSQTCSSGSSCNINCDDEYSYCSSQIFDGSEADYLTLSCGYSNHVCQDTYILCPAGGCTILCESSNACQVCELSTYCDYFLFLKQPGLFYHISSDSICIQGVVISHDGTDNDNQGEIVVVCNGYYACYQMAIAAEYVYTLKISCSYGFSNYPCYSLSVQAEHANVVTIGTGNYGLYSASINVEYADKVLLNVFEECM